VIILTKDNYYEYFNKSVKDKTVKITLQNDSSFTNLVGIVLENDTLISYGKLEGWKKSKYALSDIAEIKYTSNDFKSASILLRNGDKISGENIITNRDSIFFVYMKTITIRNHIVPIDKVKTVSYKNRWIRMPLGLLAGTPLGLLSGIMLGHVFHTTDEKGNPDVLNISMEMAFLGGIVGIITSSIIGYDYIYQFNP
jgi:hypothetical protein